MDINEIIDFIMNRFSKEYNWMNGNCYWFAATLCARFKELIIWYEPIEGHFYAGDDKGIIFIDWQGAHINLDNKPIKLSEIAENDDLWYSRLLRDCVY